MFARVRAANPRTTQERRLPSPNSQHPSLGVSSASGPGVAATIFVPGARSAAQWRRAAGWGAAWNCGALAGSDLLARRFGASMGAPPRLPWGVFGPQGGRLLGGGMPALGHVWGCLGWGSPRRVRCPGLESRRVGAWAPLSAALGGVFGVPRRTTRGRGSRFEGPVCVVFWISALAFPVFFFGLSDLWDTDIGRNRA